MVAVLLRVWNVTHRVKPKANVSAGGGHLVPEIEWLATQTANVLT